MQVQVNSAAPAKRIYVKPTLTMRAKLQAVTAGGGFSGKPG